MFARTLFNAEHEMFRDAAARFVAEHVVPHHDAWEKAGVVSREMWLRAGEQGLLCVTVPEAYGGPGADFLYAAIVLEEFVKKNASGPGLSVHSDIVAPYLVAYASEELKQAWLPKMCRGEAIGAIGMTEPGVGSDLQSMRTRAVRDGDDWVVSGQKTFISNGQCCDFVIVAAKTDPDARGKGVSLILVETDRVGFTRGRNLEKVGYKAQDTSELFFEDVRVPAANLVGVEGRGFVQLMEQLPQERLTQAVRAAVMMEAALDWTVDYTRQRQAFGRSVSDFQNTRFKLAEIRTQAVLHRVFIDRCIEMHLEGKLTAVDAAMAKMASTEAMNVVMDMCLQLHGGSGYMWEMPIARAWADARMSRIAGGTGEIMRELIGRDLVGRGA